MTELVCKLDDRITADNTGFTSGGGTCKIGSFCCNSSTVQVYNIVSDSGPNAKPETVMYHLLRHPKNLQ